MAAPPFDTNNHPGPAEYWAVVTTSDLVGGNFSRAPRGIWVGGAGDVALVGQDDGVVTFSAVPAGTLLPCRPKRVNATGTNATLLVAIW